MKLFITTLYFFTTTLFIFGQSVINNRKIPNIIPSARINHTMVEINGSVYLFGGEDNLKRNFLNDLWVYTDGVDWEKKTPSNPPSSRQYHTATKKDGKMYVFGGSTSSGTVMDIWEYDPELNQWFQKPSASGQNPKLYHRATTGENKIWITGGYDEVTNSATGEIWGYDVESGIWTQGADCPSPRYGHASFYNNGKVYITTGRRGNELLNDMWQYDVATNTWTEVATQGVPDKVKFAAFDSSSEVLWIAGGTNLENSSFVDSKYCWEYDIAANQWTRKYDGPVFSFGAGVILPNNKSPNISEYEAMTFGGSRDDMPIDEQWFFNSTTGWGIVGIHNIGNEENDYPISVYPNPTTGLVNINCNEIISKIEVINHLGQVVETKNINRKRVILELNNKPNGFYFIRVVGVNFNIIKRVELLR